MEKQRTNNTNKFIFGLLIFLNLFISLPTFSQTESSDIKNLRVSQMQDTIFSNTETLFSLIIPGVKPAEVQVDTPQLPRDANFMSMRRTDYIEQGMQMGTKVDIWLSFQYVKKYTLPPLNVRIKKQLYEIPFNAIDVSHNPATTVPKLIIKFDNGVELIDNETYDKPLFSSDVSKKMFFTVYLQYAVQVIQFSWAAPKDAILAELKRYEITEGQPRGADFTSELIPVASFEWQPLLNGNVTVPEIQLTATSYSGARVKLYQPIAEITIEQAQEENITQDTVNNNESYFSYAFTETNTVQDNKIYVAATQADCQRLATLRIKERNSFFPWKISAERKLFEAEVGLTSGQSEPSFVLFILCIILAIILLALAIIFFAMKKRTMSYIIFSVVAIISMFSIIYGLRLFTKYGIFKGGEIRSVPYDNSGLVSPIASGERVRIEETAGKWIYIQFGNTGGWVTSSSVILIR